MPNILDPVLAQAVIDNMTKFLSTTANNSPHASAGTTSFDDSLLYFSGSEFLLFNGIISGKNFTANPHKHFAEMKNFFSTKKIPFVWWWTQPFSLSNEIQTELENAGLKSLGIYSGIAAKLNNLAPAEMVNNIKIKEVTDEKEYGTFINILSEVFQFSASVKQDCLHMLKSYDAAGMFKHYLGYYDNEPVATGTGYVTDNIIGLYNLATLPHARKYGICTLLLQQAMHDAHTSGCDMAVAQLMAPGMAKGLTEKLGFNTYCHLLPYSTG